MIDTVKFQVRTDKEIFKAIQARSITHIRRDYVNKRQELRYMQTDVHIPSYDYKITLKAFDEVEKLISFECSLPKMYYGENVSLLYPSQLTTALDYLWKILETEFPTFPSYEKWTVERLDLCYAWKFPTQERAQVVLDILKTLVYPRKNRYEYQTAVMYRGRHSSSKFYLKEPEFLRNDYKRLLNEERVEFADRAAEFSVGVLRFEITARKEQIKNWFEKRFITYTDLLDKSLLEFFLNQSVSRILQNRTPQNMSDDELTAKLESKYKKAKAARLLSFYKTYYSSDQNIKSSLIRLYSKSTICRKRRDISKAEIGIVDPKLTFDFDLSIPSCMVVNLDPGTGA